MVPTVVALIVGPLACASGVLTICFRHRLTDWQNYMYREFGWNPRGKRQDLTVTGMTVIGSVHLLIGVSLLINALIRLSS
ncbi:hypothetical protein ITJ64_10345 [Herbiconiux sp. VKM Ac-1786]|uniref:hypothetical protein n=1 Tax=Herbiconiux sp. VKM Ac-1786 TaxID=2783824 RepID=UPI00188A0610|nr:hypothetical protein [Herbiconiux sp. VKM Ac-1786]MBF4572916.1 hypothetical protein [Herbiconiux sp. VKM Ac-1786]